MLKPICRPAVCAMILGVAGPAIAQADKPGEGSTSPKVEIVKRDPDGRAEIVRIEGKEIPVCKGAQVDGCINPRDAGLDWGSRELDYWPGKPASEGKPPQDSKPKN